MSNCNNRPDFDLISKKPLNTTLAFKYALYIKMFRALSSIICLWVDVTCIDKNKLYTNQEITDIKGKFNNAIKRFMYNFIHLQTGVYPRKLFTKGVAYTINYNESNPLDT